MKEISALIFDFGCVITLPQNEVAIAKMLARINAGRAGDAAIERTAFLDSYNGCRDDYDKGIIGPRTYWRRTLAQLGARADDGLIERLMELDYDCWFRYDGAMLDFIREQKQAGTKLALLSNINLEGCAWLRKTAGWLGLFDVLVLSAEELLLKPEPAIYELCTGKLELPAAACLFIDDRQPNIDGARKAGLNACLYRGLDGLKDELARDYKIRH